MSDKEILEFVEKRLQGLEQACTLLITTGKLDAKGSDIAPEVQVNHIRRGVRSLQVSLKDMLSLQAGLKKGRAK